MDEWDILAAMGWAVVEVETLRSRVCVVTSERVVLVRHGLPADSRTDALGWALTGALRAEIDQGLSGSAGHVQRGR